ncbi:MAG: hypothetical protein J7521_22245 [Caulobacter sp.]|nr:hypothetical protein [Caulobacter sp.]
MGLTAPTSPAPPALADGEEPSAEWVAAALGVSLEDADWLLVCYRFLDPEAPRPSYYCEAL